MLAGKTSKVQCFVSGAKLRALDFIKQYGMLNVSYLIVSRDRLFLKYLGRVNLMRTISPRSWDFTRRKMM